MRTGYARVSHGGLSDTELQLAKFRVPKNISNFHDNDGLTTTGEDVEEESRFPEAYVEISVFIDKQLSFCSNFPLLEGLLISLVPGHNNYRC